MKVLIDTDCGVDDSIAIILALLCENCEVVGITCVHGNATRDSIINHSFTHIYIHYIIFILINHLLNFPTDVLKNVARVLKHTGKTNVPIFSGCAEPMVAHKTPFTLWKGHGPEGLGSAPPEDDIPQPVPGEHAALAISRLSRECATAAGGLHIVTLGPLTNLALAAMLDPGLPGRIASFTTMGGTMSAHGNLGMASEFNFSGDAEAAKIVFERFPRINLVPWETMYMSIPWDDFDEMFEKKKTPLSQWVALILKNLVDCERGVPEYHGVYLPDACTVHALLRPECVLEAVDIHGEVETAGEITRGGIFYDWSFNPKKPKNVHLIQKMDMKLYIEDLRNALQNGSYKL